MRVRIRERSPQPRVNDVAVFVWEMTGDVPAFVQIMPISA